jgi:hypothetical protein
MVAKLCWGLVVIMMEPARAINRKPPFLANGTSAQSFS